MRTTVLVPLDGSDLAARALPYAIALLQGSDGTLALVRATVAYTPTDLNPEEAPAAVLAHAETELEIVAERLRQTGLAVNTRVYYDEAVAAILDAAAHWQVDAVVMSTHGRSGPGRWLYGSVAERLLQRVEVPLLLVPALFEHGWPAGGLRHVLVPLDGSELGAAALTAVEGLAPLAAAALHLVSVVEPRMPLAADGLGYLPLQDEAAELRAARQYLDGVAAQLRAAGRLVTVETAVGRPAACIAEKARSHRADLIAMATHGRGGLTRLVMGSVTTGVLRQAAAPLLIVRPTPPVSREAVAPRPDAESARPTLTVTLSARELALVRQSLRAWLCNGERTAGESADRVHDGLAIAELLARLDQAESPPVGGR